VTGPRLTPIILLLCTLSAFDVAAQDSQYWAQRYGTSSRLLGGVVIGSVGDLSAGYYNPGAIALGVGAKFVLSAKVFQLQILTLDDLGPRKEDGRSWSLTPAPSFVAGMLTFDETRTNQWGYILLPRQQFSTRLGEQYVGGADVLSTPGAEAFTGATLLDIKLDEYWGGIMWGRRLRNHVGIGATGFIAYRGQRTRKELIGQALSGTGEVATAKIIRDFNYYNVRALAKLGVMYDGRPLSFGVSLTTPSLNLFGDGTSFVDLATSGVDSSGSQTGNDFYATNVQKGQKSEFPTSWAIGAGLGYRRGATQYTVAAEWYAPIDRFQVIETAPFEAQSTGQTLPNEVVAEYKSVFNWGIGIQHRFTPQVAAYGSFTTDFSAVVPEETNSLVTKWDLYHITAGAEFSVRKFHLTLGLEWAFGDEDLGGVDLSKIEDFGDIWNPDETQVRYDKLTLILGIQFGGENL
jgi:hypothetical protein